MTCASNVGNPLSNDGSTHLPANVRNGINTQLTKTRAYLAFKLRY